MEGWQVNPVTGVMISRLASGEYLLAVPNRSIETYAAQEVEHVVMVTPNYATGRAVSRG